MPEKLIPRVCGDREIPAWCVVLKTVKEEGG